MGHFHTVGKDILMRNRDTLIIGASLSGLASAAALQKHQIDYLIIEKEHRVAAPWHRHYDRLHLHTNKGRSALPYKKFAGDIPRYPSRQQLIDYLDDYRNAFKIDPVFNTEALLIKKEGYGWLTETNNGSFRSANLIMATGPFGKPATMHIDGMETFPGKILHSSEYRNGEDFRGEKVLVVGFGNSACEIAMDLYEQGSIPSMSVRSPVNVIPRDVWGLPVLELSILLDHLPSRIADAISAPLIRWLTGDLTRLGLKKMPYGPLEQIRKDGKTPVLDIGTIRHIRKGHIKIFEGIGRIKGESVYFKDGQRENFHAIVAATGYQDRTDILNIDKGRREDLKRDVDRQKYFGRDGLYFCGHWISPTGQIREIASDAKKIAKHIAARMDEPGLR
jgi:indole-3-pyruvate monooxygenase